MSHLDNGFRSLTLQRFPATDDVNPLQAWEAADEYLLQHRNPRPGVDPE